MKILQPTERDRPARQADVTVVHARTVGEIAAFPSIAPGEYRVHMIDVGTGLSILVQGNDFNLLYDAGSNDDLRGLTSSNNNSRVVAYLWAALGASGPKKCKPAGDTWPTWAGDSVKTINHVVLSHPHQDHGVMLDDVLTCYRTENVWDVGVVNDKKFYLEWWQAVASEVGVHIHTVAEVWPGRRKTLYRQSIKIDPATPWSKIDEGQLVQLGEGASFKVLHADAGDHNNPNENTLVLRVDLGSTSLLLTGDAESGARELPSSPVGDIEKHLMGRFANEMDVDILQVGHHGSLTSSRLEFLRQVSPEIALVSSGPTKYRGKHEPIVLPDEEVIAALELVGATVYRTDENDKNGCPAIDRVGTQEKAGTDKERPGGCDNFVILIP